MSHHFKVVLLGEAAVGKTSLICRYCDNSFNEDHNITLKANFLTKKMFMRGSKVILDLWDTAGQERYAMVAPIYYRDAHGAFVVFSVTDKKSWSRCQQWVAELRDMHGDDIVIHIIANKIDLVEVVDRTEVEAYCLNVNAKLCLCSAKTNLALLDQSLPPITPKIILDSNNVKGKIKEDGCC